MVGIGDGPTGNSATMPTTLNIELSQQMQTWLSDGGAGNGVSAYALLYGSATAGGAADTPIAWTSLVTDGAVQGGGSLTLDLTTDTQTTLYGGKVYFIIQSIADPADAIDPSTLNQSAINWTNAASLDYRYDSIEVALTGSAGDAANLTSIGGFGIGMALEASTGSRSYAISAAEMFGKLATAPTDPVSGKPSVATFTAGGLAGQDREAVSPAVAAVPGNDYPVYSADDWDNYVDALKTPATPIIISGYFNGAGDLQADAPAGTAVIWRNAGFFSYALDWREGDGSFWLTPTEGSQIQGAIKLTPEALANSIYATRATVELYETPGGATPYQIYANSTEMNTGANNAWGQVLQQLTLGLTAGYLESTGTSPNSAVTTPIDLNKNYNWVPTYAFGTDTDSTLGSDVVVRWDPFSQLFYQYSNSYGTQYADALMTNYAQGMPQLPTYASGTNIPTLTVTLFADSETPTAGAYTPPVIYDYVAGSGAGGKYAAAQWHDGNPSNIAFNFNPGDSLAQSLVLKDDVALSIRILTGYDGDTPQWQDVAIGGAGQTPWQNWTFGYANGTYSLTGNGGAGQTSQSLILTGPPMADSGVGWYQIVVTSAGFEKVYNLYTTTFTPAATPGDPDPIPQFSDFSTDPSLAGIDGLATLTAGATQTGGGLLTFSVAVTGVTPTLDLSLMQANTTAAFLNGQTIGTAPVAGTLSGGTFAAVAGQTADVHGTGGNGVDLAVIAHSGHLAFGWTGLNTAADTGSWTETFTNLVQGKSIAVLDVAMHGGTGHIAPMHAKADLAGGWHTSVAHQFGNGTYDVTMTAYDAKDEASFAPDLTVPLTRESATLTLTVQLSDLTLQATAGGAGLELLPDSSDTAGNWIHFAAMASNLADGVAIAFYATDTSGNPVGPDGLPVGSIADAVLGWVGAVGSDSGATLLQGAQSIYLETGLQLRFALVDRSGGVADAGPVTIDDHGDGTLTLGLGGITLDAGIGNTLSADMQSAAVQRIFGMPLIYANQGDQLEVALVGSSHNANRVGFVRLDLDHATGAISLDGIAQGDSDAFRDAVRGALDAGFGATVGGDFAQESVWTVAGETGYYAPVLITQSGEIFVTGGANRGGHEYIRTYGANSFGFEDLAYDQASDFDYNDLVMTLRPVADTAAL
jgi:hypothetical protein